MKDELYVALTSLLIGWGLGQGAELLKDLKRKRILKNSLKQEVSDISENLSRTLDCCYKFRDNEYIRNNISITPFEIETKFYDNFYHETILMLCKEERRTISIIYGNIKSINILIKNYSYDARHDYFINLHAKSLWANKWIESYIEKTYEVSGHEEEINNRIDTYNTDISGLAVQETHLPLRGN